MFDNIGGKIKAVAKVVCWFFIVISVLSGLFMIINTLDYFRIEIFATALLTMIIGSLVGWLSSLGLYGFGELIERTTEIAYNTRPRVTQKNDSQE